MYTKWMLINHNAVLWVVSSTPLWDWESGKRPKKMAAGKSYNTLDLLPEDMSLSCLCPVNHYSYNYQEVFSTADTKNPVWCYQGENGCDINQDGQEMPVSLLDPNYQGIFDGNFQQGDNTAPVMDSLYEFVGQADRHQPTCAVCPPADDEATDGCHCRQHLRWTTGTSSRGLGALSIN